MERDVTRTVILGLLALGTLLYLYPIRRADVVLWIEPTYHPEYYTDTVLPFTGYIYPVFLLMVFAAAAAPHLTGAVRLPAPNGAFAASSSSFALLLLGVLGVFFILWLAITPVF